jgi:hypothetical protein
MKDLLGRLTTGRAPTVTCAVFGPCLTARAGAISQTRASSEFHLLRRRVAAEPWAPALELGLWRIKPLLPGGVPSAPSIDSVGSAVLPAFCEEKEECGSSTAVQTAWLPPHDVL